MKTGTKIFLGVLGAATVVSISIAGATFAAGGTGKHGWARGHGMGPAMLFERFDSDGDGKITREEADTTIDTKITAFDSNTDGSLSLEEFQGLWTEQMREMMVRAFQRLDRDGDGEVTRDEINNPIDRAFSHMDRNEDGAIEKSEMRRKGHGHRRHKRDDDEHDSDG